MRIICRARENLDHAGPAPTAATTYLRRGKSYVRRAMSPSWTEDVTPTLITASRH
jgi:hypothetical protein